MLSTVQYCMGMTGKRCRNRTVKWNCKRLCSISICWLTDKHSNIIWSMLLTVIPVKRPGERGYLWKNVSLLSSLVKYDALGGDLRWIMPISLWLQPKLLKYRHHGRYVQKIQDFWEFNKKNIFKGTVAHCCWCQPRPNAHVSLPRRAAFTQAFNLLWQGALEVQAILLISIYNGGSFKWDNRSQQSHELGKGSFTLPELEIASCCFILS